MSSSNPNSINAQNCEETVFETDIVIIGSGAGGGISAEIFAQKGFKVLLIEEGPHKTARDFTMRESEAYTNLYQEAAARQTADKAISILQGRAVGGSTTVNWTSSFRTPKKTLNYWRDHFSLNDFTDKALMPWFELIEKRLHISTWKIPANENNLAIQHGAEKLGWSFGKIARNVNGCANLGYCGMGCPINAKQSMLITTIPSALKLGAKILSQARVNRLLVKNDDCEGCEVQAVDEYGQLLNKFISIKAKQVILSAGAIGSPAVLLRSKVTDPYQNIGSRTFLHPVVASAGMMPKRVDAHAGAPQSLYSDHFLWPAENQMGFKIEAAPLHPILSSTMLTNFGQQHSNLMQQFPYLTGTLALLRDGFDEKSVGGQVVLDKHEFPKLDYPVSDYVWEAARKGLLTITEMLFAAGAKKVYPLHRDAMAFSRWSQAQQVIKDFKMKPLIAQLMSAHVMGGCAMGNDAQTSVVDQKGKFHHLHNLYIFDGSIFPTSIGANPQLSIYAIVARLATELADRLKHGENVKNSVE